MKKLIYGAIAAACVLAASMLLMLGGGRRAVAFAEFSPYSAFDAGVDCYINELTVLDRYAEETGKARPSELLLVRFSDSGDVCVLLSLLVEPSDAIYEPLSPYFCEDEHETALTMLSGYFFCEPLHAHNVSANEPFYEDAARYAEWTEEDDVHPIGAVLRYAGGTEPEYEAAQRRANLPNTILIVALLVLAAGAGIRLLTLRSAKPAKDASDD